MFTDFMWPELDNIHVSKLWFQEDSATSHISDDKVIKEYIGDRVNGERSSIDIRDHTYNLTSLDYAIWATSSSQSKLTTSDELEPNIWDGNDGKTVGGVI